MNKQLPNRAMLLCIALFISTPHITTSQEIYSYRFADFAEVVCRHSHGSVTLSFQTSDATPTNSKLSIQSSSTIRYLLSPNSHYQLSISHPTGDIAIQLSTDPTQAMLILKPDCQASSQ